jgi:hypothetical protein
MSDIVLRFPFDLTGSLTSNAVRHPVVLGPGPINRAFAFPTGPFFVDTLRIVAANKPTVPLVRGKDFEVIFLHPKLTKMVSGREICLGIVITNRTVPTDIIASAQIVGGPMGAWVDAIERAIADLQLDNRAVDFSELRDLPEAYAPAPSYKDIGDLFGFEYVIVQIAALTDVVNSGESTQLEAIKDIFDSLVATFQTALTAHVTAEGNVHHLDIHQANGLTETEIRTLIQGVQKNIDDTIKQINDLKTSDTQINARIDAVIGSMQAYNLQLTTVGNNYQKMTLIVANLQADILKYKAEVASLKEQLAQVQRDLAATNAQVAGLSQTVTTLSNTVTAQGQQILALQQSLAATNATIQAHISANDPHPNYLHKQMGGQVNASVRVVGNFQASQDVQAES